MMEACHVAHGLQLRSTFPLAGMAPTTDDELPSLALELASPARLAARWSGTRHAPLWRGNLGDGCELTIECGTGNDLLFTYGERARFHLDAGHSSLICAPYEAGLHWQRALLTKMLANVSLLRGCEALHASAVDSAQGALAIVAPSGTGKTTLALELMRRGYSLLTDDVLTLATSPGGVVAHPATPHMNLAEEHDAASPSTLVTTLDTLGPERWVVARRATQIPRPVHMICLLERRPGLSLGAQLLPPGPLALAPYMLGLGENVERERRRFALYADLAASATMLRLSCDTDDRLADLADLVEALADRPPVAALGSAA